MKRIFVLIILIALLVPNSLFAEAGQKLTVDGYYLHISATKLSSDIVVTGTVKGGKRCDHMKITIYLLDDKGSKASVSAILKNYGNSDRFTIRKKGYKYIGDRLIVSDVYISTK